MYLIYIGENKIQSAECKKISHFKYRRPKRRKLKSFYRKVVVLVHFGTLKHAAADEKQHHTCDQIDQQP